MKIERNQHNGNLSPEALNCLASIPENNLFNEDYDLRSPAAIYNVSVSRISAGFKNFLDVLDESMKNFDFQSGRPQNFEGSNLLAAYEEILEAFMAHIDDFYEILKSMVPLDPKNKEIFANKYLKKAKFPGLEKFIANIGNYRTSIAPIVNKIKHQHGRLQSVVVYNSEKKELVLAFYVEGIKGKSITFDPAINNGKAISYNHALRFHFFNLYFLGQELSSAIRYAYSKLHNSNFPEVNFDQDSTLLLQIANRIMTLPVFVLPYEANSEAASVVAMEDKQSIKVEFPSKLSYKTLKSANIAHYMTADGFTKSFQFNIIDLIN